jgi:hypothetical protein
VMMPNTILMSAFGTKRQFAQCKATSGAGGKADLPVERPDFSVSPQPDIVELKSRSAAVPTGVFGFGLAGVNLGN